MEKYPEQNAGKSIEELLEANPSIQIEPLGNSMYPMIIPGRDKVILEKADENKLRRGDVVLYRRASGMLVLHRLAFLRPEGLYMVGDNQSDLEGPLQREQVIGVLTAFIRKGRSIPVKNPVYRITAGIWLLLLPLRTPIHKTLAFFRGHRR